MAHDLVTELPLMTRRALRTIPCSEMGNLGSPASDPEELSSQTLTFSSPGLPSPRPNALAVSQPSLMRTSQQVLGQGAHMRHMDHYPR